MGLSSVDFGRLHCTHWAEEGKGGSLQTRLSPLSHPSLFVRFWSLSLQVIPAPTHIRLPDLIQQGADPPYAHGQTRTGRLNRLLRRILPTLLLLSLWAPAGFAADIMVMTAEDRLDAAFATFDFPQTAGSTTFCGTVVDSAAFPAAPSLREALIYANHTPGPDTITFAPELSGQTLMVSFDGSDEGEEGDPLPNLCGGDITLNGDIDGDGTPDITLDGSNIAPNASWGFYPDSDNNTITGFALHSFRTGIAVGAGVRTAAVSGNRITNNTIDGGVYGVFVFAGLLMQGTTSDTTVSGNTVSGTSLTGILASALYTGSALDGTRITDNVVGNSDGAGIFVSSSSFAGTVSQDMGITNTTIQDNDVSENSWAGIVARIDLNNNAQFTQLRILENHASDNGSGILVQGGQCGATGNMLEAEIARNTLAGNGTGIEVQGGGNAYCGSEEPLPPSSQNHVTVTITDNVSEDADWTGINIQGGFADANQNTVTATLTGNTVLGGNHGLHIQGGSANYTEDDVEITTAVANGNTVTATLTNNRLEGAMYAELDVAAGGAGSASDNTVTVTAENNIVCGSSDSLWGQGGRTDEENSFWANAGTGNTLTVTLTDNSAGAVNVEDGVAGNTAMLTESGTQSCGRALENPRDYSPQSGLGVITGWVCEAEAITVEFEHGETEEVSTFTAGYGTSRADTMDTCSDTDNGFSLLFNWNLLGDGMHTVRVLADGVLFGRSLVMASSLGLGEFATGLSGTYPLADFPLTGITTTLQWEESLQNFVIAAGAGGGGGSSGAAPQVLENPSPGSFQSGLGAITGWVCAAEEITIEFHNGVTGEVSTFTAGYGTSRADTMAACGDADNGFSLLYNWNLLGNGLHTVRALADGVEFANVTVTVSTLGGEFVEGLYGEFMLDGFPGAEQTTTVEWEESLQNFVVTEVESTTAE